MTKNFIAHVFGVEEAGIPLEQVIVSKEHLDVFEQEAERIANASHDRFETVAVEPEMLLVLIAAYRKLQEFRCPHSNCCVPFAYPDPASGQHRCAHCRG